MIVIEYAIDCFVWIVNSGLVTGVISISVTVGIVKIFHQLFRGVSRYD